MSGVGNLFMPGTLTGKKPAGTNANTGLDGDPTRRANAVAAGLPTHFFRANPDLQGGVFVTGNGGYNRYGTLGAPTGRYLAPANGPDCIESIPGGSGQCGTRSLVIAGPMYQRVDLSAVKRVRIAGSMNFEFRAEMINAFNHPNFNPVISTATGADSYRTTGVVENSSRIVQLGFL